jgi:hypothetical protein
VWHFVTDNYEKCTYSPALAEASSEAYSAGTRLSALAKQIPTALTSYYSARLTECCQDSQSGTTCERCTGENGAGAWISYLEDSLARTSVPQVLDLEYLENLVDCGESLPDLLVRYDPDSFSLRTVRCSESEVSTLSCATLPHSGTMLFGNVYKLEIAWPHTRGANVCGSWPTPTVCGNRNFPGASEKAGWGLQSFIETFYTPCVVDSKQLAGARQLTEQLGGKLNPDWTDWLMGWPIGWSGLRPLAMDRFQTWLDKHGVNYASPNNY